MPKRGYDVNNTTIELYEGNLDLIFYNNPSKPKSKFYFYRWSLAELFPDFNIPSNICLLEHIDVVRYLKALGLDYFKLRNSLIEIAETTDKKILYDM